MNSFTGKNLQRVAVQGMSSSATRLFSTLILLTILLNPLPAPKTYAAPVSASPSTETAQSPSGEISSLPRPLDLQSRLICRRAVEEVYWQHRIWPEENPTPKPGLDQVLSLQALQAMVEDDLRLSNALAQVWQQPITGELLQAEINRMAASTRLPDVLSEVYAALGNDPYLVAECLARPVLANRLIQDRYQSDPQSSTDYHAWWHDQKASFSTDIDEPSYAYRLENPSRMIAQDDTWTPTPALPEGVGGSTAVWTGSEMIIWGGATNFGARYDPTTDTWTTTYTIGAPSPRRLHTAVWTGSEMIVWGGCDRSTNFCTVSSGGRYNPLTNSWTTTLFASAPVDRMNHTAVWTGTHMIVWAGCSIGSQGNNFCNIQRNDGGVYDPTNDTWQAMTTAGAPAEREYHQAVWADGVMVVWGGYNLGPTNTGGRYDPVSNTWLPTSLAGAPSPRANLSMVWTGSEVIVWGGCNISLCIPGYTYFNTGGRYDPLADTWTATDVSGAPEARGEHTAIWTGSEMIIWGGRTSSTPYLNTGSRYNPSTNSWTPTGTAGAPAAKTDHHAIWTGSEMIVWGGYSEPGMAKTGGRYDPTSDSWTPTNTNDPVWAKERHTAVWTGTEMLIWGGSTRGYGEFFGLGIRFDAVTGTWSQMETINEPAGRFFHNAVWTGSEMIVWGGHYGTFVFNSGGRYNPITDSWTATSLVGTPSERTYHAAVWSGSEMIVWGGTTNEEFFSNTGNRYNPSTDSWTTVSTAGAPTPRAYLRGIWDGSEMIIWGGYGDTGDTNTGGRYDPTTNTWSPTSTTNAPTARHFNTAIWTGSEMIVWGGMSGNLDNGTWYNSGGRYNPTSNTWTPTSLAGAPSERIWHVDVWTGSEMIVWGGCTGSTSCSNEVYTGGRYDLITDSWMATSLPNVPSERANASAVWTGSDMIVWAGLAGNVGTYTTTGGFYHVSTVPNNPPQAVDDSYSTDEDSPLNVAAPGVLGNDTDADGDELSAVLVSSPIHGSLALNTDGSFIYTPALDYNGGDTFSYRASDGIALSDVAVVTITVNPLNDPPVAVADSYTTSLDTSLVIPAPGVLANDSDPDGDPLRAILVIQPLHGSLVLDPDGSFTYIPDTGYAGLDQFTYQAHDGTLLSEIATVSITITSDPTPPQVFFLPLIGK